MSEEEQVVCVTGANGFIGSWLVLTLLEKGYYTVHASVYPGSPTSHLRSMGSTYPGRLHIFEADILDVDAVSRAVQGCHGVFHVASPCNLEDPKDPQSELVVPAVQGTLNVLEASRKVRRVVLTSSISAMVPNPAWPNTIPFDETSWTDLHYCQSRQKWYPVSKTLAEKAAWEYAEENGMDIVAIHPSTCLGRLLQPSLNASCAVLQQVLQGSKDTQEYHWLGAVHVKDVANAQVLLFETPSASGSIVVKGVVCKKNVAHRRMTSKIEKRCFLVLGGALEYQRVTNHLSSFDTLLQQEMDHLKMAVAKIDAHHPNVLLVEKSVSRFAQDYLLAKDISLVLNIKRPLLERIVWCTGAQIVPSIHHLSSQKLGYCDTFHVEKFLEEHGTAGQAGKKLVKTLMFFEGCPKPLGCTILLKGASGDELKKVKHVLQYGVFAAYHLALETSFLADEGASLPELPLKSPITVALPDKPSNIARSISTIPGFTVPSSIKAQGPQLSGKPDLPIRTIPSDSTLHNQNSISKTDMVLPPCLLQGPDSPFTRPVSTFIDSSASFSSLSSPRKFDSDSFRDQLPPYCSYEKKNKVFKESGTDNPEIGANHVVLNGSGVLDTSDESVTKIGDATINHNVMFEIQPFTTEFSSLGPDNNKNREEPGFSKEEFPPSPSDHQSILVSLSTRCVWKGTVCERSHLFRIKYYGSFDKPLGRFLRDHLFDQSYRCRSCEMPSEAHVHCYTHRQGSLTISVKKLPEFLLPGEREGKIWMWHRCLRCPRVNGFPPATQRIVMSDAAWGLSFGKFLELSYSNHAAASRVASCGHSIHRDCLRFYGKRN